MRKLTRNGSGLAVGVFLGKPNQAYWSFHPNTNSPKGCENARWSKVLTENGADMSTVFGSYPLTSTRVLCSVAGIPTYTNMENK